MSRDPDCVFCKILDGKIPCADIWQDDRVLSFLDIGPLSEGHILVIPRTHYERLSETPPEDVAALAAACPRLGRALLAATGAEGYNLLVNEGKVAGQAVPHVHVHLIPRNAGDGLGYRWNAGKYSKGRIEELQASYRNALGTSE